MSEPIKLNNCIFSIGMIEPFSNGTMCCFDLLDENLNIIESYGDVSFTVDSISAPRIDLIDVDNYGQLRILSNSETYVVMDPSTGEPSSFGQIMSGLFFNETTLYRGTLTYEKTAAGETIITPDFDEGTPFNPLESNYIVRVKETNLVVPADNLINQLIYGSETDMEIDKVLGIYSENTIDAVQNSIFDNNMLIYTPYETQAEEGKDFELPTNIQINNQIDLVEEEYSPSSYLDTDGNEYTSIIPGDKVKDGLTLFVQGYENTTHNVLLVREAQSDEFTGGIKEGGGK